MTKKIPMKKVTGADGKTTFFLLTDPTHLELRKRAGDLAYEHPGVGYWALGRLFWAIKIDDGNGGLLGNGMSCTLREARIAAKDHYSGLTGEVVHVKDWKK